MKPSDKQLSAGVKAFNECDIVSTPHCIAAAYDAMTEAMTVEDVPERVRREIQAETLICYAYKIEDLKTTLHASAWMQDEADRIREGK